VQTIRDYQKPRIAKELRRYLGMINYYRRFVSRAAEVLSSLNDSYMVNAKERAPVIWTPQAERAFEMSKKA